MRAVETILVAFSMYSALPVPQVRWREDNLRYALCAFPLVGTLLGLCCWGWVLLCAVLRLPALLRGVGLCLLPVLFTGGIHLDGYADTWDALSSHADIAKKQAILRDPHIGTFAVIRLCGLLIARLALWSSLPRYEGLLFVLSFTLSRALSGLSVVLFPLAPDSSLAKTFAGHAHRRRVRYVLTCAAVLLSVLLALCGWGGVSAVAAAALVFLHYRYLSARSFGGLSGDLAGWFLERAECWMLSAVLFAQYLEDLL